ncbi:MAG TPA: type VI secretion system tube protein Hcp [Verrucomicrobiae bacterium]|nr:type VI secretion system tube protein Hcp [Verrucomicrobiae bacterium]
MKSHLRIFFCVAALSGLGLFRAAGAYEIFLSIPGIPGESTAFNHTNDIVVESFSFGVSAGTAMVGGGGTTSPTFTTISISKPLDKASPLLYVNCAAPKNLGTVVLTLRDSANGTNEFYKVTMSDVTISSVKTSGEIGEDRPTEFVTLSFKKIQWKYTPIDSNGKPGTPVVAAYDLSQISN